MADSKAPLAQLAKDEEKFRARVVGYIAATLKSNLPVSVKIFVLMMLFLIVLLSFQTGLAILHLLYSLYTKTEMPFKTFFYMMSGEGLLGVFVGIPLVTRMTSLEETQRLEASLVNIQEAKESRSRRKPNV